MTDTCDASAVYGVLGSQQMFGPCVLRFEHRGPVHRDANGTQWTELPDDAPPPTWSGGDSDAFHARCVKALHDADTHSCQEQDGVDYVRLADAVNRVRDKNTRVLREWIEELAGGDPVAVPRNALKALAEVAMWVSRGRSMAFVPDDSEALGKVYPDAKARRALGALDDAGLLEQFREG